MVTNTSKPCLAENKRSRGRSGGKEGVQVQSTRSTTSQRRVSRAWHAASSRDRVRLTVASSRSCFPRGWQRVATVAFARVLHSTELELLGLTVGQTGLYCHLTATRQRRRQQTWTRFDCAVGEIPLATLEYSKEGLLPVVVFVHLNSATASAVRACVTCTIHGALRVCHFG